MSNPSKQGTNNQVQNNKALIMKVDKDNEVSSVAFFGVDVKQIRTETPTQSIKIPNDKKERIIFDINEAIKQVMIKNGAKHYQFKTMVTDGKDDEGQQMYKYKEMTKLCIPFEIDVDGAKGFEMFHCDSWKKNKKTQDYIERY